MQTYSTYDFYKNDFGGTETEKTYNNLAVKSCAEINMRTFNKLLTENYKHTKEEMAKNLAFCECELIEAFARFKLSNELLPVGINSINNDGFSASTSYGSSKTDSRETAQYNEITQICNRYLLFPVNLLYAGVKIC